jgi:O-antigen ligase
MTPSFPLTRPYNPVPVGSQEQINPIHKLALFIWLVELAIFYSRFFDVIASGMHIPAAVLILLVVTSVMNGIILRGFANNAGKCLAIFSGWVGVTAVFGIWRGGSIPSMEALLFSLLYFSVVSGLIANFRQLRQTMSTLAGSLLVAALMGFVFGIYRTDRLLLAVGQYSDPNQYAMCLLIGIPLWWFIASLSENNLVKVLCYLCTLPMFVVFFKTGSRGGLLGLIGMLTLLFLQSSLSKKVMLVVFTVVGAFLVTLILPNYVQQRYKGAFEDASAVNLNALSAESIEYLKSDSESAAGRKALLFKSIEVTLRYPVFGVGPGNFPAIVFADAQKNRDHYSWLVTHNSYTQISSESGIPALLLFLGMLIYSFKNLNSVLRLTGPRSPNPKPELWKAAFYLRLSLTAICICIFFLSEGFTAEIYVLVGLSIALKRIQQFETANSAPLVVPAPVVVSGFKGRRPAIEYPQKPRFVRPNTL